MGDLVVIGGGLTGLFASVLAASKGADVALVTLGRGGLSLSSGCIDAKFPDPSCALDDGPVHPLILAGRGSLRSACDALRSVLSEAGLPYAGSVDRQLEFLTPLGRRKTTQLAPASFVLRPAPHDGRTAVAGLQGFRDFIPSLAVRGLAASGEDATCIDSLPWPGQPPRRDRYSSDFARSLDRDDFVDHLARLWRPLLDRIEHLGIPAVLGLCNHSRARVRLESALGLHVFEIATLPPSVPGLRLERALRNAALSAGVRLIEGARAASLLERVGSQRRALGIVAETAGGARTIHADNTLLATGGIVHGGLETTASGEVLESVFHVPVAADARRETWVGQRMAGPHAFARFGVRVNTQMQTVDASGEVFASNLFAAGGVIAGPDRCTCGCRQGIDLATAYRAIEVMQG